jgi:predicted flap endonuclease-1-like 5' DNA nuclease
VHDGYWGGAPDKVQSWYAKLIEALRRGIWPDAAYIAGVLSHYYTDPIQPFHTAQSEAENNIHRAVEWSIAKSYDELMRLAGSGGAGPEVPPADDPDWLRELVCRGAETSNRYYEKLIAHYDFNRGVVDPPAGLDAQSRQLLAELLDYAARGFALILDRAFTQAAVEPPEVDLRVETVLAGLEVPLRWVTNRIADAGERRLIERMYDELAATGRVEENLPEDDRTVRDLYREEVLAPRELRQRWRRSMVASKPSAAPMPAPARAAPAASQQPAAPPMCAEPEAVVRPIAAAPVKGNTTARRTYLALGDAVERAPAIGAKTAARLASAGIETVADLLAAEAGALAARLDVGHISAAVVRDWQDQARLMMAVPGLRGTHSQLIVGAGYRTARALAAAEASALSAAILRFVGTREGQRVLRDGSPPDLDKIMSWIASAADARAA